MRVDVLKIDVEGYECEVLKGAGKILEKNPDIILEIHADNLYECTVDNLFEYLSVLKDKEFYIQWEDWLEPELYNFEKPITGRSHLFTLPKKRKKESLKSL